MSILNLPDPLISPSIEDFHIICRICLRKGGWDGVVCVQPIGAYIDRLNPEKEQDLYGKIRMCSNIELHHNDDVLPNNICDNCVNLLFIAHYFKQLTANSDSILRRIVNSVDEKPVTEVKVEWDYQHNCNDYEDRDNDSPLCDIDLHSPEPASFNFDNRVYICDVCHLRFPDKSSLSDHMISHKDTSLTDHTYLKDEDNSLPGHVSSECKIGSVSTSTQKVDLGKHKNSEKLSESCKEKFSKNSKDNDIKICKKVEIKVEVDDNINLEESKQDDSNMDEPVDIGYYECLICNTLFSCKEDLSKHMYSHENLGKHKCYGCDVVFEKYSKRTHHEKYYCPNMPPGTKYECRECNMNLDDRFSYDAHVKFRCILNKAKPHRDTIEFQPILKCPHCEYITVKRGNLNAHVLTCHSVEKPYVCEICGKGYSMVGKLNHHRKLSHVHRDKIFKCTFCPHVTNLKGSLDIHMRIHTKETRYSCEICGKHFKHSSGYHIHIRRFHREKEFECEICKKKFSVKRGLQEHMSSVHLGLKPHVCKVCGAAYSRRRSLKDHSLKIHNISLVKNSRGGRKCREDLAEAVN